MALTLRQNAEIRKATMVSMVKWRPFMLLQLKDVLKSAALFLNMVLILKQCAIMKRQPYASLQETKTLTHFMFFSRTVQKQNH
jgi:hypothetical protein